jgi:hypothetical protein
MATRAPTRVSSHPSRGAADSGKGNNSPRERITKMFDISELAVKDTAIVELETVEGDALLDVNGNQLSITVYGPGSKAFQKAQSIRNRAILEYVKKGGKKMKEGEQRELDAEFLSACTVSFNGFGYKDFTGIEMFKAAYLDSAIGFITEQVNKAVGDWANFTQASSKT